MEQAPVELGSEVGDCHRRGGPCVDKNATRPVGLTNTIARTP